MSLTSSPCVSADDSEKRANPLITLTPKSSSKDVTELYAAGARWLQPHGDWRRRHAGSPHRSDSLVLCLCEYCSQSPTVQGARQNGPTAISKAANVANGSLKSFNSERALRRAIGDVQRQRESFRKKQREKDRQDCLEWSKSLPEKVDCNNVVSESVMVSGMAARADEDTNRQHASCYHAPAASFAATTEGTAKFWA